MEIGDGNAVGGAGGDQLLRQMQAAHDEEVERVRESESFDRAREAADDVAAEGPGGVEGDDPVERRVLETAERALDGEFDSAGEARDEVVETIVEERYSGMIDDSNRDDFVQGVKDTLADDVAFRNEVDNMLMHAARRLGRHHAA